MGRNKTLEAVVSIAGSLDPSLAKSISGATKQFGGLKTGIAVAGAAAVAATAAAVKFGTEAVKSAAAFESKMANVGTLLDGSTDQVNKRVAELGDQVLEVSNKTGVATDELSAGLYDIISAVGDSEDATKQMELASKAALAGNAETTDSIALMTAVTKAYGDTSYDSMQKASDLAFETVKLGQTTFPDLANSMQQVTGLSNTLGVSQEDLFGVMATATGVTGDASRVATQLKAVYSNLMKPTSQMAKGLKKIGFASADAAIESLGLQGTLDALSGTANGNQEELANMFSSVEGLNLVLSLTGDLSGALTKKTKAMYQASGATEKAFKTQTDTLEYQLNSIKNLGKNFMTDVGQEMLPMVKEIAEKVLPAISSGMKSLKPYFGVFSKAIEPIFEMAGKVAEGLLPGFKTRLLQISAIIAKSRRIIERIAEKALPVIGEMLGTVFDAAKSLSPVFNEAFGVISESLSSLEPVFQNVVEQIMPVLSDIITHLAGAFQTLAPLIAQFIADLMPVVGQVIQAVLPIITTLMSALGPIIDMVAQLVSILLPLIMPLIQALMPVIQGLAFLISEGLSNAFAIVLPLIQLMIDNLGKMIEFVQNVFSGNWEAAWGNIKDIFASSFNAIVGIGKTAINAVAGSINKIITGINGMGFIVPDWVPVIGGKAFNLNIPQIPMLENGGFTNGTSIAGEAGVEAVISFKESERNENLSTWAKAGQMLGVDADDIFNLFSKASSGSGSGVVYDMSGIQYSPSINIMGDAKKEDVIEALREAQGEFEDFLEDFLRRREAQSYEY
ncbi:MAG: phage tail tape measure protein [bacterium]|nr:phage tail tape measure protein [bacterium]